MANQKWFVDISYVWTREGWLYLAAVLDLYSRRVIGWAASNRMKRDLAIRALIMATHGAFDPFAHCYREELDIFLAHPTTQRYAGGARVW
jgi:transposase InsO family protein